jgi:hypothetical protein
MQTALRNTVQAIHFRYSHNDLLYYSATLTESHALSLTVTTGTNHSLSVTVTMSLSHSFELSLTVTISMGHWLALNHCHYVNKSLTRSHLLSLSQWVIDSHSITVTISTNHWHDLTHCHYLNESPIPTQTLSQSQQIIVSYSFTVTISPITSLHSTTVTISLNHSLILIHCHCQCHYPTIRLNCVFIKILRQGYRVLYMKTNIHFWSYLDQFFLEWGMFQTEVVEENKTQFT